MVMESQQCVSQRGKFDFLTLACVYNVCSYLTVHGCRQQNNSRRHFKNKKKNHFQNYWNVKHTSCWRHCYLSKARYRLPAMTSQPWVWKSRVSKFLHSSFLHYPAAILLATLFNKTDQSQFLCHWHFQHVFHTVPFPCRKTFPKFSLYLQYPCTISMLNYERLSRTG